MYSKMLKKILPSEGDRSLGYYRLLYFGWLTLYFCFYSVQNNPRPSFYSSFVLPGIFQFFDPRVFDPTVITYIYPIWIFCLFCTCIGFATSIFSILSFILGYWIFGVNFNNGVISYQEIPHLLILLIFAVSQSSKSVSVDGILFPNRKVHSPEWDAKVSILLLRTVFILVYFSSAITKIKKGAYIWALDGNAVDIFSRANIWFLHFPIREYVTTVNVFLVKNPILATISVFTIFVMELMTPLLFLKRFKRWFVPMLFVFQLVATFALYIDFLYSFIALFVFWINFEKKSES